MKSAAQVRCSECGCPVGYIHSTSCSKYPEVHKRSAASTLFDVPAVKEALWLLLGGGLDVVGKTTWLALRLDEGRTPEEIFADALAQIGGMVAT